MGQKLSSKILFICSPNTDGLYRFYISQGSVATRSVATLLQIFHKIRQWKFWESVNTRQKKRYGQKFVAYFLGHPVFLTSVNFKAHVLPLKSSILSYAKSFR